MNINPTLGLDIGGTKIRGAIVSESGQLLYGPKIHILPIKRNRETFETTLFECLNDLIKDFKKHFQDEIKIGIGSAGPVAPLEGVLHSPENIGCGEYEIVKRIMEEFPVKKVTVINDCEAIALGYYKYAENEEQGLNNEALGLIAPGTGLGAAMIINGRPYWGGKLSGYLAVELSKTPYFGSTVEEVKANLGKDIEDFASGLAVYPILMKLFKGPTQMELETYIKEIRDEDKAWIIEEFAREQKSAKFNEKFPHLTNIKADKNCLLTYKNVGKHLGYACAAFTTNFNPNLIVLEGSIMKAYDLFYEELITTYKKSVYKQHSVIPLVLGNLEQAGIKGASYYVRL